MVGASPFAKNIILVNTKPTLHYPLEALQSSSYDISTFINTDCPQIVSLTLRFNIRNIPHPPHLAGDDFEHGDEISNAVEQFCRAIASDLFAILINNTVMVNSQLVASPYQGLTSDLFYDRN